MNYDSNQDYECLWNYDEPAAAVVIIGPAIGQSGIVGR